MLSPEDLRSTLVTSTAMVAQRWLHLRRTGSRTCCFVLIRVERWRLEGRKHDGPGHGFCIWHGRQHHGPGVPHSSRRVVRCDEWETTKVRIELCLSQVHSPAPMMVAQRWSHLRRAAQRHDRSRSYTSAREPRWTVDRMIQPTAVSAVAKDAFSARQA
jgi:hypothetical protein